MNCVLCKKEYDGYGNNAEPIKTGYCCDKCNAEVIKARLYYMKWKQVILEHIYQTTGINNAIADDYKFAKVVLECLGKYATMNWGETCKEDCEQNNNAVFFNNDRIVAKYKTNKGNIFIITERDRSATTTLFAWEY